jgi:hypothetical protein
MAGRTDKIDNETGQRGKDTYKLCIIRGVYFNQGRSCIYLMALCRIGKACRRLCKAQGTLPDPQSFFLEQPV